MAELALPDTGSLDGDLRALAYEIVDTFTEPASAAVPTAVIHAAFHSVPAATALHVFLAGRHARAATVIARAVDRGELASTVGAAALVRSVSAPLYFRLFITGEAVDRAVADQAAGAAARAGAFG